MKSLVGATVVSRWGIKENKLRTDHDYECEDVIENDAERGREIVEAVEIGGLHDAVQHRLHDEARHARIVINLIHTDESLQEANHDDNKQGKEDERFPHHNFQHDQHGAEESESIQIEEQAHPKHRRRESEEVVAELVELPSSAVVVADRMSQGDQARDEADAEEGVEGRIEDVPKTDVIPTDLPELAEFIEDETSCHEIQYTLHDIQITCRVDCIDDACVYREVED